MSDSINESVHLFGTPTAPYSAASAAGVETDRSSSHILVAFCVNPSDGTQLVLCDQANHRLQIIRPADGTFVRSVALTMKDPWGVCPGPVAGTVAVSYHGSHAVQVLRVSDGAVLQTFGSYGREPNQLQHPWGLSLVGNVLVVCDFGNHRVQVIS